jgi:hypothetical protein
VVLAESIEQRRFVILAGPRTGSTYLVDYLDRIRDITCCSELFQDARVDFRHHRPSDPRLGDPAFRDREPLEFLDLLTAEMPGVGWFGFKMIGNQIAPRGPEFLHRICHDRRWKKIYLWRDDLFEQSVSIILAARHFGTGVWGRTPNEQRVRIAPGELLSYLHMVQALYFVIEAALAHANAADVFALCYRDLGRPEVMVDLLTFLGLPDAEIEEAIAGNGAAAGPGFAPGPRLADRVENLDEIRRYFLNGRYREMIEAVG